MLWQKKISLVLAWVFLLVVVLLAFCLGFLGLGFLACLFIIKSLLGFCYYFMQGKMVTSNCTDNNHSSGGNISGADCTASCQFSSALL